MFYGVLRELGIFTEAPASTTTEKAAPSSAAPGTMPLVTSPAESVARKSATRAGKASTALSQFVCLDVTSNTAFATNLGNANAEWVGRGDIVMSASDTQAAFMVPVSNHGSATARKAGVAFSVTRTLTTAPTTSHAKMVPHAPTPGRGATLVLADLDTQVPTARLKSMNVMPTLARTVEAALILRTAIPVPAHRASMVKTVS